MNLRWPLLLAMVLCLALTTTGCAATKRTIDKADKWIQENLW